jgi:5-methylthioadenosine/S-adenosylhomocysteine deaminase
MNENLITIDLLICADTVLTCNLQWQVFSDGAVAVKDGVIVAVGEKKALQAHYAAVETRELGKRVLMPGLVNSHTHVPMNLLRGLSDDLRLDVWLLGYIMPVERQFVTPEMCELGTALACAEMIRSGVTTFADMYYFEDVVAKTTASAGLRALACESILKFPAPDAASWEDALAYTRDFLQKWQNHPLIVPGIAPHAPYTTTAEILQACSELALEFNAPLQIHLAETEFEVQTCRKEHGMPVIPWVKKNRILEANTLAAHCVWVDEDEIKRMAQAGVGVLHNPTSNLKLGSGVAPIARMLELGVNVGIGTDGAASNNDLDMFEEMRLAALVAKGWGRNPTALPAQQVIGMATRMGAASIHLGQLTGSLEVGKRADLIAVDLTGVHNSPTWQRNGGNAYAQLVYSAKSTDVTDVMVNGKWLMREHQLLTLDEKALLKEAESFARRVDHFLIEREQSVFNKLVAIGTTIEQEYYEVQAKLPIENPKEIIAKLTSSEQITLQPNRFTHYRQYDTYFHFTAETEILRIRSDETLGENGVPISERTRLTLIGPSSEREEAGGILVSRSRFLAQGTHSLRFYREYFRPERVSEVEKDRKRWYVVFKGIEFAVNVDEISRPPLGSFLEVKCRTWSKRDAKDKANAAAELLRELGLSVGKNLGKDYVDLVEG